MHRIELTLACLLPSKGKTQTIVNLTCVCAFGLTTEEILKASRVYEAAVIVMGMRGAGAISQALLGSTTMAVVQASKVPVLAVPAHSKFKGLQSVVAAIDLNKLPDQPLLKPLRTMATAFKSQLHVLHLQKGNTPQTENKNTSGSLDALGNSLQDIEYDVHSKQAEDVASGIQDYVEEKQADLLALLPGQHTFLNRLMSKSITGQMAGRCFVPLLTLPGTSKTALRREEAKQEKN